MIGEKTATNTQQAERPELEPIPEGSFSSFAEIERYFLNLQPTSSLSLRASENEAFNFLFTVFCMNPIDGLRLLQLSNWDDSARVSFFRVLSNQEFFRRFPGLLHTCENAIIKLRYDNYDEKKLRWLSGQLDKVPNEFNPDFYRGQSDTELDERLFNYYGEIWKNSGFPESQPNQEVLPTSLSQEQKRLKDILSYFYLDDYEARFIFDILASYVEQQLTTDGGNRSTILKYFERKVFDTKRSHRWLFSLTREQWLRMFVSAGFPITAEHPQLSILERMLGPVETNFVNPELTKIEVALAELRKRIANAKKAGSIRIEQVEIRTIPDSRTLISLNKVEYHSKDRPVVAVETKQDSHLCLDDEVYPVKITYDQGDDDKILIGDEHVVVKTYDGTYIVINRHDKTFIQIEHPNSSSNQLRFLNGIPYIFSSSANDALTLEMPKGQIHLPKDLRGKVMIPIGTGFVFCNVRDTNQPLFFLDCSHLVWDKSADTVVKKDFLTQIHLDIGSLSFKKVKYDPPALIFTKKEQDRTIDVRSITVGQEELKIVMIPDCKELHEVRGMPGRYHFDFSARGLFFKGVIDLITNKFDVKQVADVSKTFISYDGDIVEYELDGRQLVLKSESLGEQRIALPREFREVNEMGDLEKSWILVVSGSQKDYYIAQIEKNQSKVGINQLQPFESLWSFHPSKAKRFKSRKTYRSQSLGNRVLTNKTTFFFDNWIGLFTSNYLQYYKSRGDEKVIQSVSILNTQQYLFQLEEALRLLQSWQLFLKDINPSEMSTLLLLKKEMTQLLEETAQYLEPMLGPTPVAWNARHPIMQRTVAAFVEQYPDFPHYAMYSRPAQVISDREEFAEDLFKAILQKEPRQPHPTISEGSYYDQEMPARPLLPGKQIMLNTMRERGTSQVAQVSSKDELLPQSYITAYGFIPKPNTFEALPEIYQDLGTEADREAGGVHCSQVILGGISLRPVGHVVLEHGKSEYETFPEPDVPIDLSLDEYIRWKKMMLASNPGLRSLAYKPELTSDFIEIVQSCVDKSSVLRTVGNLEKKLRELSYYDDNFDETMKNLAGASLSQRMMGMEVRAKELGRNEKWAGICYDFALLLTAGLQHLGIAAGHTSMYRPELTKDAKRVKITTADAHGASFAVLPSAKSSKSSPEFMFLIADSTPSSPHAPVQIETVQSAITYSPDTSDEQKERILKQIREFEEQNRDLGDEGTPQSPRHAVESASNYHETKQRERIEYFEQTTGINLLNFSADSLLILQVVTELMFIPYPGELDTHPQFFVKELLIEALSSIRQRIQSHQVTSSERGMSELVTLQERLKRLRNGVLQNSPRETLIVEVLISLVSSLQQVNNLEEKKLTELQSVIEYLKTS